MDSLTQISPGTHPTVSLTPFDQIENDLLTDWNDVLWWLSIPLAIIAAPFVVIATALVIAYQWIFYGNDVQTLLANTLIVKVDRAWLDNKRAEIVPDPALNTQFVQITTSDNVRLDGIVLRPVARLSQPPESQKWIVYFSGVHGNYETYYNSLCEMSKSTGANILCVNYRGIGRSEGSATCSDDVIKDARASLNVLLSQGVLPKNALLYGHSFGGALAAAIAKENPNVNVALDRTFESLFLAVRAFIWFPIYRDLVAWAYGQWWNFDSYENLRHVRGRKWLIVAHQDFIIAHRDASLFNAYVRRHETPPPALHLRFHIEPLNSCRERMTDLAMTHTYDAPSRNFVDLISDFLR